MTNRLPYHRLMDGSLEVSGEALSWHGCDTSSSLRRRECHDLLVMSAAASGEEEGAWCHLLIWWQMGTCHKEHFFLPLSGAWLHRCEHQFSPIYLAWVWASHLTALSFLSCKLGITLKVVQSCPILCEPTDYSPPGSSVHGILQARILE